MEKFITLAHGSGGRQTSELIGSIFKKHFANELFTPDDAAVLPVKADLIAMSTDGFVVSPWRFAGGNIGKLSICGTVNDIACMGAIPKYITCAFIIEEGFPVADLEEIAAAMAKTAAEAGVKIVAGDTKVVGKGQVDKVFITTAGVGEQIPGVRTSGAIAQVGDAVIVSGDVGRHGSLFPVCDVFSSPLHFPGTHKTRKGGDSFLSLHGRGMLCNWRLVLVFTHCAEGGGVF
ncbi:MAG: hypothetical protein IKJ45_03175 [Kiritimatiellae bacterium]|nr:hypothetical protein [Kiritimatiellia bacterium]